MSEYEDKSPNIEGEQENEDEQTPMDYEKWDGIDVMKSLCMRCQEEGETRFMLHKIPHFRELVLASFFCQHCGERNNEVTFGGEIQKQGIVYTVEVMSSQDLDRQVIKSDSASFTVLELDFEIPPSTQKGDISTIEGVMKKAANNLALYQSERMAQDPTVGQKVSEIILKLTMMSNGVGDVFPFHVIVNDPAGNSFVQVFSVFFYIIVS